MIVKIWEDCQKIESTQDGNYLTISLPFSSSIVPEPGKIYSVVVRNEFDVRNLDTGKVITGALIDYYDTALVLTFIGKAATSNELTYFGSSIAENQNLESIDSINFEFNEEFDILNEAGVEILSDNKVVYSSSDLREDPENPKFLTASFEDAVLYLGNTYTIRLSAGTVCLKGNSTEVNRLVEIKVNGTSTKRLSTKSVSIADNAVILPDNVSIKFNLEPGQTLTPPSGVIHKRDIDFYKGEISEENFISTLHGTASGDGIKWDLSTFRFEPETKYVLHKKADDITVWVNGKSQPAYAQI